MIVDSSAWIEFLRRDPRNPMRRRVEAALRTESVEICDAVRMEVLAGARDEAHKVQLAQLLARARLLETTSSHYELAAALYRACRREGETVRQMLDCLIAAVAIDAGLPVLYADRDFDVLARHTGMLVA